MTNTLQARGTIQVSGFILIGRDPGHRCRINQRSPPHTLPDTRPHIDMRKPFRTSEKIDRWKPKCIQQHINHAILT